MPVNGSVHPVGHTASWLAQYITPMPVPIMPPTLSLPDDSRAILYITNKNARPAIMSTTI